MCHLVIRASVNWISHMLLHQTSHVDTANSVSLRTLTTPYQYGSAHMHTKCLDNSMRSTGLLFKCALWLMLWGSINAGPWNLRDPQGFTGYIHAGRALLPLLVLPASIVIICNRRNLLRVPLFAPSRLLAIYGLAGFILSVRSPEPFEAFYWAAAYLAAVATAVSFTASPLRERDVRWPILLSWLCVFVILTGAIIFCRGLIFSEAGSAYDTYSYAWSSVYGMPMVLSSGMGRNAGVIGVVVACTLLRKKTWRRLLWVPPFLFFTFVVFRMQSRGAMIAYTVTLLFIFAMVGVRWRVIGPIVALMIVVVLPATSRQWYEESYVYYTRGADREGVITLSGRTDIWALSDAALRDAWIVGWGHQGDRTVVGRHIHNAILYAAIATGFPGCIVYVTSWIQSWAILWRSLRRNTWTMMGSGRWLLESTAIFLFFSIRSITETTTASFSIDLLVVLPLIVYVETLNYSRHVESVYQPQLPDLSRLLRECDSSYEWYS